MQKIILIGFGIIILVLTACSQKEIVEQSDVETYLEYIINQNLDMIMSMDNHTTFSKIPTCFYDKETKTNYCIPLFYVMGEEEYNETLIREFLQIKEGERPFLNITHG